MRSDDLDKLADAILDRMTELERVDELASSILRRLQAATPPGLRRQMARSLAGFVTAASISCPTGSPPYLCTTSDYYIPCHYPDQYDDTPQKCLTYHFYSACGSSYQCQGQSVFGCKQANTSDPSAFSCGNTDDGPFTCRATKFDCDTAKLVDFVCMDTETPFQCHNTFTCEANHCFVCGVPGDGPFACVGGSFNCQAGMPVTTDCCAPQSQYLHYSLSGGDPGGSTDTQPGDFGCFEDFTCQGDGENVFVCAAADDFTCGLYGIPTAFACDHFHCTDGATTFECFAGDYMA